MNLKGNIRKTEKMRVNKNISPFTDVMFGKRKPNVCKATTTDSVIFMGDLNVGSS